MIILIEGYPKISPTSELLLSSVMKMGWLLDNILVIWMVMAPPGSYLTYYKNQNEFLNPPDNVKM